MRIRRRFTVLAVLFLVSAAGVQGEKRPALEDLMNFSLGAEYAQWLVGPVSRIATPSEIDRFLALTDDQAAADYIDEFWNRRADPSIPWPDDQPRAVFESRAAEADRQFTEGVTRGRRTDRGEIYIVFGPPPEIDYEDDPKSKYGPIEVWRYGKKAPPGLGGDKPKKLYRFAKIGELTKFYSPGPSLKTGPSNRRLP